LRQNSSVVDQFDADLRSHTRDGVLLKWRGSGSRRGAHVPSSGDREQTAALLKATGSTMAEPQPESHWRADHCAGAIHAGALVVHRDSAFARLADLRGCNSLYNSRHSNSGMNLPRRAIAEIVQGERFFGSITETHSQLGNVERVARREADATCVDSDTYACFCRHRPPLGELTRVLGATTPSPSVPFVTSIETPASLQDALRKALRNVARSDEWGRGEVRPDAAGHRAHRAGSCNTSGKPPRPGIRSSSERTRNARIAAIIDSDPNYCNGSTASGSAVASQTSPCASTLTCSGKTMATAKVINAALPRLG
jgi:ABC transporter, phosphonate, periplasmic substrate-binding protein